jgi:hypothetical protein
MKSSLAIPALPSKIRKELAKLGRDISLARRRRRLPVAVVAERALVSRATLARVERGEPGVSMGIYASVLFALGLTARIGNLADPGLDTIGLSLEEEQLPKRVRLPKPRELSK